MQPKAEGGRRFATQDASSKADTGETGGVERRQFTRGKASFRADGVDGDAGQA